MKIKEIFNILDKSYPFTLQDEWDRSGIDTNEFHDDEMINTLITLDVNEKLVLDAIAQKVNLIISHHPLYIEEIDTKKIFFKKIDKLLKKNRISIISCHTNFDKNKYGMNYHLCKKINLKNLKRIDNNDYIYFGELSKPAPVESMPNFLKNKFDLEYVILPNNINPNNKIKRIAMCGGAGSSFINDIKKKYKIDLYITSEIKWNYWINNNNNQLILCEVPHHIEKEFIVVIYNLLSKLFESEIDKFQKYEIKKNGIY